MRTNALAVVLMALVGPGSQAHAQARCPELTRLRGEVAEALKQTRGGLIPASGRCAAYNRLSVAWEAITEYAKDNREACDISTPSLDDFEKYHVEAMKARDNVCAGRPARPFPPEIIQR
jgi:hypothetical protein